MSSGRPAVSIRAKSVINKFPFLLRIRYASSQYCLKLHIRKELCKIHDGRKTKTNDQRNAHELSKLLCVASFALLNHVDEVVCEDERNSLPLDSKLRLKVPQNVAEVYVEELKHIQRHTLAYNKTLNDTILRVQGEITSHCVASPT